MYFAKLLLGAVIFYLLLCLYCPWSFDAMWVCKNTVILPNLSSAIAGCSFFVSSAHLISDLLFPCFFLGHAFGWFFLMLWRAKLQDRIFCLEVNQWQVTETDGVLIWSAEDKVAYVLLCLGFCLLHRVVQNGSGMMILDFFSCFPFSFP